MNKWCSSTHSPWVHCSWLIPVASSLSLSPLDGLQLCPWLKRPSSSRGSIRLFWSDSLDKCLHHTLDLICYLALLPTLKDSFCPQARGQILKHLRDNSYFQTPNHFSLLLSRVMFKEKTVDFCQLFFDRLTVLLYRSENHGSSCDDNNRVWLITDNHSAWLNTESWL